MTEKHTTDLKELQKLDLRILAAKQRIVDFEPLLEEVELPALTLESDLATTRNRLQEMKVEERRLEVVGLADVADVGGIVDLDRRRVDMLGAHQGGAARGRGSGCPCDCLR